MSEQTLVLDSPSLIYRAYFALPSSIQAPDGQPVNAARGYLEMVSRLIENQKPRGLIHVFDADWRPQWRVDLYEGYKTHRLESGNEEPDDLGPQFEIIIEILDAAGQSVALADGYEADDVIGTIAAEATTRKPVAIVSGDRDLLQLVRDPAVQVLHTIKGVTELGRFDEAGVLAKYGVKASQYADFAILRGDPSDGLPGVSGIGEKTAAKLISEFESIDKLMKGIEARQASPLRITPRISDSLRSSKDYLKAMQEVVPVVTDVDYEISEAAKLDEKKLIKLGKKYGLENAVERFIKVIS